MSDPSQIRLVMFTDKQGASQLFDILDSAFEDQGYAISTLEVDEEAERFEVAIYVPDDEAIISHVQAEIKELTKAQYPALKITHETIPDIDWVTKSLEGLEPVRAGRFVVHGSHDRGCAAPHQLAIEIEAGRAFGTGHHGTTAGCLEMITQLCARNRPQRTLDLGAGSAVLAIGVAKLARTRVLATDIDPIAMDVGRRNVRLNQVQSFVRCETATGFSHNSFAQEGPFDLIIANILPAPLMKMAPEIAQNLANGGDVILSGVLTTQRRRVLSAFALQGLAHRKTLTRGEWVTLHLKR